MSNKNTLVVACSDRSRGAGSEALRLAFHQGPIHSLMHIVNAYCSYCAIWGNDLPQPRRSPLHLVAVLKG